MKIQVGDKVRFLDEPGEGKVTRIINDIAYVLIEDGFEIPTKINQLVVIEKASQMNVLADIIRDDGLKNYNYADREDLYDTADVFDSIETKIDTDNLSQDIYLAFVPPDKGEINLLTLYLINDIDSYFTFTCFKKEGQVYSFLGNGSLEPNTKIELSDFTKETFALVDKIIVQGILFKEQSHEKGKLIEKELKLPILYLLNQQYYKETDFFDEPAFLLSVLKSEKNLEKQIKEKLSADRIEMETSMAAKEEKPKDMSLVEVDLHIEALLDDYASLTAGEMLHIQIEHFRKKLEECILNTSVKKVVFIHGVGNGTLKLEIRRILSREYGHYDYQDASFQEYGYGATMVILRR